MLEYLIGNNRRKLEMIIIMKIWHSFCIGTILCGTVLGLSACGQKSVHHKVTAKPMVEKNITGGGHKGYFQVVHSTKQLKHVITKKKNESKEILINTNLNGNTNGLLQNKIQQRNTHLQNRMNQLKQKPKLRISNNVKESQKQKMAQAKKVQQNQWNRQKQQQKQLNNKMRQTKQIGQRKIQQETQPVTVKIPSNTTLVSSPNISTQNINFVLKGKNIKMQNMNIQVPSTKNSQKQMAIKLYHVNGVKLDHDEITGVSQRQNNRNRKKRSNERPITKGIAVQELHARHIYVTNSKLTGLATGLNQMQNGYKNNLSISHSQVQGVNLPFQLASGNTKISNVAVQYNRGLSLLNINNPEKLQTQGITITVNDEKPDAVANQLLKMAKNTTPTYFINRKIEINGHGYKFITKKGNLQIQSIPSPNNVPVNNVGAILSRTSAIRD